MTRNIFTYATCIKLIQKGFTTPEIAIKLNISENCVRVYARESGNNERLKRNNKSLRYYGVRNERDYCN